MDVDVDLPARASKSLKRSQSPVIHGHLQGSSLQRRRIEGSPKSTPPAANGDPEGQLAHRDDQTTSLVRSPSINTARHPSSSIHVNGLSTSNKGMFHQ